MGAWHATREMTSTYSEHIICVLAGHRKCLAGCAVLLHQGLMLTLFMEKEHPTGAQLFLQLFLSVLWMVWSCDCFYLMAGMSIPCMHACIAIIGEVSTSDFIRHGCRANPWVQLAGWNLQIVHGDWLRVTDLTLIPEASASVFGLR